MSIFWPLLIRVLQLWRGQTRWLLAGLVLALAALAAGIGVAALAGLAMTTTIAAVALWLRGLVPLRVGLRYLERLTTHNATFRALADLRVWFFRGLARGAAGGLGFRQAGDVLARLVSDVEALDGLYLRVLLPLGAAILLTPALLVVLGMQSWPVAMVVGLTLLGAVLVLPWQAARTSLAAGAVLATTLSALRVIALDTMTGRREVRAFGAEGHMLSLLQAREASLLTAQHRLARRVARAGMGAFLCSQAALLAVLVAAVSIPTLSMAGSGLPAILLLLATFEAVGGLPRAGALAGHAATAAQRVLETAETPARVPDPASPAAPDPGFTLRFEAVQFRWQPDRPLLFAGLNLEVAQGARIALLGPSGAGKSTLAALALKLAAPQSGRIILGKTDIATLTAAQLRTRIGWLSQSTHLFDSSIRENLLLARPDADAAMLWAALEAAHIADLVHALPDGLETWVGEAGARFSGGQGRRLALARTLLSPAPILILDEPCAGLDPETERDFFRTLNQAAPGRSIILIAHRLTGAERLDRIYRLSAGHAVTAAI